MQTTVYTFLLFPDPNECDAISNICGNGDCVNEDDEDGYYHCQCHSGYQQTGDLATMSQTCVGECYRGTVIFT